MQYIWWKKQKKSKDQRSILTFKMNLFKRIDFEDFETNKIKTKKSDNMKHKWYLFSKTSWK